MKTLSRHSELAKAFAYALNQWPALTYYADDDLVADFFMGSGSTVKAALALGRRAIGVELETGRFEQTVREVQDLIV
ncbi:DNA methylase [Escherichia coli]|nr:DNA methylase [Escherichia coli]CTU61126.1 DNA methylase [Escherichia coli]CTV94948.1 DNA methylase [Escherichia coli]CTW21794.1 DNA methylase [Escherichia coli]CTW27363.1 DNA methylase [Escherichia coli]